MASTHREERYPYSPLQEFFAPERLSYENFKPTIVEGGNVSASPSVNYNEAVEDCSALRKRLQHVLRQRQNDMATAVQVDQSMQSYRQCVCRQKCRNLMIASGMIEDGLGYNGGAAQSSIGSEYHEKKADGSAFPYSTESFSSKKNIGLQDLMYTRTTGLMEKLEM